MTTRTWVDGPAGGTPINAARLNGMETDIAAKAGLSDLAATNTSITQLASVSASVEELSQSISIQSWVSGTTVVGSISSTTAHTIFVPQIPCKVISASLAFDYFSLAANDTNYLTLSLRRNSGGVNTVIVTKTTQVTGGEAITARVAWSWAMATWTDVLLSPGDMMTFQASFTGTLTMQYPVAITFRYVPV